jgi:uncharacterized protein YjbJ (UPF0337 family)
MLRLMNKDQIEGQWRQVSGRLTSAWGEATHDLGKRISGNGKRLVGVLQSRFGALKQEADKTNWMDNLPSNTTVENVEKSL